MDKKSFRYLACGGGNTLLDIFIYFISYKFILQEQTLDLGFYAFKPHVAALFISVFITFPIGFFMSKYVVFNDSSIKGRIQLFRYFMICMFNLALNYLLLKIFVEVLHIYPVLAQVFTIAIVVVFSYLAQRNFSFKANAADEDEETTD